MLDRLHRELMRILAMPEVKEKLAGMSFEPETVSGAEFRDKVSIELKHWSRVVEATGVKID